MRMTTRLFVCALLALPAQRISAQEKPPVRDTAAQLPAWRLRIMGIYDDRTGAPVEGADVIDVVNGNSAKTTSTGTVSLAFMPDGGGLVRIRKLGYDVQTMMVSIAPTDSLPITIILQKVVELAAVNVVDSARHYVSPGLRAFEDRRTKSSSGYFIPESTVRKEENRNVGEFLRSNIPSLTVVTGRTGAIYVGRSPRCGAGGPPAIYLDGVLLNTSSGPPNISEISLPTIAAVEYYPNTAGAPPEFNHTATSCGALVFWSRER